MLLEKEMATHSNILAWRIPMDRGAWWATVHRVAKSWAWLKRLSMHTRACAHYIYAHIICTSTNKCKYANM